jgi:hypothetical protein
MLEHGIAGSLDPVRHLTGLTKLNLGFNGIGGASFLAAVAIVVVGVGVWCGCQREGVYATHTRDIVFENHIAGSRCADGRGDGHDVAVRST